MWFLRFTQLDTLLVNAEDAVSEFSRVFAAVAAAFKSRVVKVG